TDPSTEATSTAETIAEAVGDDLLETIAAEEAVGDDLLKTIAAEEAVGDELIETITAEEAVDGDRIETIVTEEAVDNDLNETKAAALADPEELSLDGWIQSKISGVFSGIRKKKIHINAIDAIYVVLTTALSVFLMFLTFLERDGKILIAPSVHSDFSPHMAVLRSFSRGNNFPSWYPHFAGQDMKYHFMFQFLAGNLEFLGLRIDFAFNIPSILGMVGAFFLLYALTVKITGKRSVAALTGLFFAFRSSMAFWSFIKAIPKGTLLETLINNRDFIGTTAHEDWGLYNLNVYVNQSHLALGLCIMLFVVYCMMDRFLEAFQRNEGKKWYAAVKDSFISKEGWMVQTPLAAVGFGLLLGMTGFFHGSCVIACILILFAMAMVSDRRLEYLIIACLALPLVFLQTHFFTDGSVTSVAWYFGFLAENKTLIGVADFLIALLGILPILIAAVFMASRFKYRWLILAFSFPLIFAFTISMTPDIAVNHKYIMMSTMYLGMFAALFVNWLWNCRKRIGNKLLAIILIFVLTCSGVYDFWTVIKRDYHEAHVYDDNSPVTQWVSENTCSRDIFLSSWDTLDPALWGGASLYFGWPYYAWSAGYDTYYREARVKEMFESQTKDELIQRIEENQINYILLDNNVRMNTSYVVNEELIADTFECVFSHEWTQIYDTAQRK
ncbi:MAG: hypothetical protein KBT01_01300, partial [Clostridiales bacterium]|nr:hypothetical protein [Candidatus Blautia equi]